jgi:hypothetical protein
MHCLQSCIDVLFSGVYACLLISVCVADFMSSLCKMHEKQRIISTKKQNMSLSINNIANEFTIS